MHNHVCGLFDIKKVPLYLVDALRLSDRVKNICGLTSYLLLVRMTIKLKSLSPTSYTVLNTVLQQSTIATYPYLRNCWIHNCMTLLPSLILRLNSTILETVNFLSTIVHDESFTLLIMQYSCKCCVNKAYFSCETMYL